MMLMYALERRHSGFILAFACGCALSSAYGFLAGTWPFGVVEAIWTAVALNRYHAPNADRPDARSRAQEAVVPVTGTFEERPRPAGTGQQIVRDGKARHRSSEQPLHLVPNRFHTHLVMRLRQDVENRAAYGAELAATIRPASRRPYAAKVLVL